MLLFGIHHTQHRPPAVRSNDPDPSHACDSEENGALFSSSDPPCRGPPPSEPAKLGLGRVLSVQQFTALARYISITILMQGVDGANPEVFNLSPVGPLSNMVFFPTPVAAN